MTGGMAKYWIIPRVGDKELPRIGHQLASCSLLNSYVLIRVCVCVFVYMGITHIFLNIATFQYF